MPNITPKIKKKLKTLQKCTESASGVSCIFFRLTPKVGVKVYRTANRRDHCYGLQKIAAKHGLAPAVGNKIKLSKSADQWDEYKYAFLTEAVKDPDDIDELDDVADRDHEKLEWSLRKIGINNHDNHTGNLSVKNHKLILIDFSHAYMPKVKKYKVSPCEGDEGY